MLWTNIVETNYERNIGSQFQMLWNPPSLNVSGRQKKKNPNPSFLSVDFLHFLF